MKFANLDCLTADEVHDALMYEREVLDAMAKVIADEAIAGSTPDEKDASRYRRQVATVAALSHLWDILADGAS